MNRSFPDTFAILRDGLNGPSIQVLRSQLCEERRRVYRDPMFRGHYEIMNLANVDHYTGVIHQAPSTVPNDIHVLRYVHPETGDPQEVYYWYLPYSVEHHRGTRVPLLEFQYRSWLPVGYQPIPIRSTMNDIWHRIGQIQEDRLAEIRRREDNSSLSTSVPVHRDIPFHQPMYNDVYDTWADESRRHLSRVQTPTIPPRARAPEPVRIVEVPVERVVVQQRILPLPKSVGDALLRDARTGNDACPILQMPYSECEKLTVSSCFHIFDKASLATWQQAHTSCPVCRCKIENVVSE